MYHPACKRISHKKTRTAGTMRVSCNAARHHHAACATATTYFLSVAGVAASDAATVPSFLAAAAAALAAFASFLASFLAAAASFLVSAAVLAGAAAVSAAAGAAAAAFGAALAAVDLAAAGAAGAPDLAWPFTCKPSSDSFTELFGPTPLTLLSKSAQSLKGPPLARSSTMAFEVTGPMPLTLSSAAWSALLTSTWANAKPIVAIKVMTASNNFLNI